MSVSGFITDFPIRAGFDFFFTVVAAGGGYSVEPGRDCLHDGVVVVSEHSEL